MSLVGSVSTKVAGSALRLPKSVTVMVVAPEITWLFVTTSPFEVMIIPVPWSSCSPPVEPPKTDGEAGAGEVASIDTTAGSTLSITASMLVTPLSKAGPAEISLTVVVASLLLDAATMPPPTRAPMSAAARQTTAQRHTVTRFPFDPSTTGAGAVRSGDQPDPTGRARTGRPRGASAPTPGHRATRPWALAPATAGAGRMLPRVVPLRGPDRSVRLRKRQPRWSDPSRPDPRCRAGRLAVPGPRPVWPPGRAASRRSRAAGGSASPVQALRDPVWPVCRFPNAPSIVSSNAPVPPGATRPAVGHLAGGARDVTCAVIVRRAQDGKPAFQRVLRPFLDPGSPACYRRGRWRQ